LGAIVAGEGTALFGATPGPGISHEFGPAAAKESLKKFVVADGLEVTLFASEPMLRNPTDMDIDERGRIWVTEGVNYRSTFQPWGILQPAGDRVVMLEDTNGDGVADEATTFYQGPEINSALGVCVLGDRVIVSRSPDVYIFTQGASDGKARERETLFRGIDGVDHDHGIHAFSFGPDGKLYFNFGNMGGQLKDKDGTPIIDLAGNLVCNTGRPYRNGMTFRCNPDGSQVEVLAYNFRNPYEVAVDSFGTLWQSDNDDDGNRSVRINYVMDFGNYGFGDELTGASWREPRSNMEEEIPQRHWHQNDPGVVPNLVITGAGAPAGILIYEGKLLPEKFRNQMILADAGTRTVKSYPVEPDGAGYKTHSIDILTSSDTWFRPSDVCVGPDGALYVADWNDAGVGGHDMADRDPAKMTGRIYRIAPVGSKPVVPKLELGTAAGCVRVLQSPNLSTRYLAWNALRKMQSKGRKELFKLWTRGTDPRMRARALYLLAEINRGETNTVTLAVKDANPDLRIAGLRIAREHQLDVIRFVSTLVHDSSAQVRRECAIALRHNHSPEMPRLWTELALQHDGRDRWYLEALGIGADRQEDKCFDSWHASVAENWNTAAGRDIVWRSRATNSLPLLTKIILSRDTPDNERMRYFRAIDYIQSPAKEPALIDMLLAASAGSGDQALSASARRAISGEVLTRMKGQNLETSPSLKAAVTNALESARGTAGFVELVREFQLTGQNAELLRTASRHPNEEFGAEAMQLIVSSGDLALVRSALHDTNSAGAVAEVLGNTHDSEVVSLLIPLVKDTAQDVSARRRAVRALGHFQKGATALLALAERGELPSDVRLTAATELSGTRWTEVKARADKLLPAPAARNAQPLPPISELAHLTGDIARGAQVFVRPEVNCVGCHRVNEKGVDFGPGLSEIGDKLGKDALYEAILDPSAGIAFGYEAWQIELKTGDEAYGIIASETADELAIKDARGITTHIKKSEIARRQQSRISIMPAGLQANMSRQDLVDLVEYLSSLKKAVR
jgi:putative membrane-bound dehydrogenase-like protein